MHRSHRLTGSLVALTILWTASLPSAEEGSIWSLAAGGHLVLPSIEGQSVEGVATADLNGDGMPDALATYSGETHHLRTHLASAPRCFEPASFEMEIPRGGAVRLHDLDGDDLLDALVLPRDRAREIGVLRGTGGGSFELLTILDIPVSPRPRGRVFIDLDQDGAVDIVNCVGSGRIFWGPGFGDPTSLLGFRESDATFAVRDFDRDGQNDVLACVDGELSLYESAGSRLFLDPVRFPGQAYVRLVDANIDLGVDEEVLGWTYVGELVELRPVKLSKGWSLDMLPLDGHPTSGRDVVVADFDGDGVPDRAVGQPGDENQRPLPGALMEVTFGLRAADDRVAFDAPPTLCGQPGWAYASEPADTDGDGRVDLIWGSAYFEFPAVATLNSVERIGEQPPQSRGALFDIDQDGFDDVCRVGQERMLEIFFGGAEGLRSVQADGPSLERTAIVEAGIVREGESPLVFVAQRESLFVFRHSQAEGVIHEATIPTSIWPVDLRLVDWSDALEKRLLFVREVRNRGLFLTLQSLTGDRQGLEEVWTLATQFRSQDPQAADLDGDGHSEIVFATPRGAQVLREGASGPLAPAEVALARWDDIDSIELLDVDGDGSDEIFAARTGGTPAGVQTVRRAPGGSWEARSISQVETHQLEGADLDGDGRAELVAASRQGILIWPNVGDDLAAEPRLIPAGNLTGTRVDATDLNGDGAPDILGRAGPFFETVLSGESGALPQPLRIRQFERDPIDMAAGDLNGDGRADFIGSQELGGLIEVFRSTATGWERLPSLPVLGLAYRLAMGDVDGDGEVDIVTSDRNRQGVWVAFGQAESGFEDVQLLPGLSFTVHDLVVDDIDSDGAADILAAGLTEGLFLYPGAQRETLTSAGPSTLIIDRSDAMGLVDADGDGALDVVYGTEDAGHALPGDDAGGFGERVDLPFRFVRRQSVRDLVADLDGDGFPDSVYLDERARRHVVCWGRGDFEFDVVPGDEVVTSSRHRPVGIADLDGDGQLDLVHADSVSRNAGERRFDRLREFVFGGSLLADADGDGRLDIVGPTSTLPGTLHAFSPSPSTLVDATRRHRTSDWDILSPADIDGDGAPELLAFESGRPWKLRVLRLAQFGDFEEVAEMQLEEFRALVPDADDRLGPRWALEDIDSDGNIDLAAHWAGSVHWWAGLGNGSFDARRVLVETPTEGGALEFADFNEDGHLDVFLSGFHVALSNGEGGFHPLRSFRSSDDAVSQNAVGDIDGDGHLDVVHGIGRASVLLISRGDGQGDFEALESLDSGGRSAAGLALGDFDADGRVDIALGSYFGQNESPVPTRTYRTLDGGGFARGVDLLDPLGESEGSSQLHAADVDGDGASEIFSVDPQGRLLVYRGSPDGPQPAREAIYAPTPSNYLLAGQVTGDSATDIVMAGEAGLFLARGQRNESESAFGQILGDCNQDGVLALSDAICLLGALFQGQPSHLPCGDGSSRHPANLSLLDYEGNGRLGIGDALGILRFLFRDGPPPPSEDCRSIIGCPSGLECAVGEA